MWRSEGSFGASVLSYLTLVFVFDQMAFNFFSNCIICAQVCIIAHMTQHGAGGKGQPGRVSSLLLSFCGFQRANSNTSLPSRLTDPHLVWGGESSHWRTAGVMGTCSGSRDQTQVRLVWKSFYSEPLSSPFLFPSFLAVLELAL